MGMKKKICQKINYWKKTRKTALDNPDLPGSFIKDMLNATLQDRRLAEPFIPEGHL